MKYLKITILFCIASMLCLSCQDDSTQRQAEIVRAQKANDSILKILSRNWQFNVPPATPKVQERIASWNEWQQFKNELNEKPTGSISAYRTKVKTLALRVDQLKNNIPPFFDKPAVRSRISVLITKIKSLYTYINITVVPEKKVITLIDEITKETASLQNQLNEIVLFSEIPVETREKEMLKALDTTWHTNPDVMKEQSQPNSANKAPKRINPQFQRLKPLKPTPVN